MRHRHKKVWTNRDRNIHMFLHRPRRSILTERNLQSEINDKKGIYKFQPPIDRSRKSHVAHLRQQQCHNNSVTTTVSQQQCHINRVTTTVSQQQGHNNSVTTTVSQQQCHNNSVTTTVSQQQCHNNRVTTQN